MATAFLGTYFLFIVSDAREPAAMRRGDESTVD
jgi:hypothetical protein